MGHKIKRIPDPFTKLGKRLSFSRFWPFCPCHQNHTRFLLRRISGAISPPIFFSFSDDRRRWQCIGHRISTPILRRYFLLRLHRFTFSISPFSSHSTSNCQHENDFKQTVSASNVFLSWFKLHICNFSQFKNNIRSNCQMENEGAIIGKFLSSIVVFIVQHYIHFVSYVWFWLKSVKRVNFVNCQQKRFFYEVSTKMVFYLLHIIKSFQCWQLSE